MTAKARAARKIQGEYLGRLRKLKGADRAKVLFRLAALIRENLEEIARVSVGEYPEGIDIAVEQSACLHGAAVDRDRNHGASSRVERWTAARRASPGCSTGSPRRTTS